MILLTDKWLPSVPFMQLSCVIYAVWPIHTANLQAINAVGRSDVFLKLEILKKVLILLCFLSQFQWVFMPCLLAVVVHPYWGPQLMHGQIESF